MSISLMNAFPKEETFFLLFGNNYIQCATVRKCRQLSSAPGSRPTCPSRAVFGPLLYKRQAQARRSLKPLAALTSVTGFPCSINLCCRASFLQSTHGFLVLSSGSPTTPLVPRTKAGPGQYFPNRGHWFSKQSCSNRSSLTDLSDYALRKKTQWPSVSDQLKGNKIASPPSGASQNYQQALCNEKGRSVATCFACNYVRIKRRLPTSGVAHPYHRLCYFFLFALLHGFSLSPLPSSVPSSSSSMNISRLLAIFPRRMFKNIPKTPQNPIRQT